MSNRLAKEPSLYLRQHAENPVHWWPWCDEAFAEAKKLNKPVLVSVGYSSCHWCHVMARESFEQTYTAELMNKHFICIKVDREEKPEVDKLMMDAVQMIQGQGGWPLNCFCLPDGRPFFGGTYFPPEDRGHGQVPWPQLLMRVADFYHSNKNELAANADAIAKNLIHLTVAPDANGLSPTPPDLIEAAKRICENHDDTHGGFSGAPKFPNPPVIDFLLGIRATKAADHDRALATRLDAVITVTLGAMARGGLYDQIGGGFHRYCVDRDWTVPHFEKMLYDNAQLIGTYAEAWSRYRDPLYLAVVEETIEWLNREMLIESGLFATSLDADTNHHEGTTYIWKPIEIVEALGEQAREFAQAYGITDQGNFEGANIPKLRGNIKEREKFKLARQKLLKIREQRPQPMRDDKILLGWNALVIKNLAKAGWIFGRKDWVKQASELEGILWKNMAQETEGEINLFTTWYKDNASGEGIMNNYASLAEAELTLGAYADWALGIQHSDYIGRAKKIMETVEIKFRDPHAVGYFMVSENREDLSVRQKDWFDNAVPAGNSMLLQAYAQLEVLFEETMHSNHFSDLSKAYGGLVKNVPHGVAHALDAFTRQATGWVVVKYQRADQLDQLHEKITGMNGANSPARAYRPLILRQDDSVVGFQICIGKNCLNPTESAEIAADFIS